MEVVGVPYKIHDGEKTVLALEEHMLGLAFIPGERVEVINKSGFPTPLGISEGLKGVGYINLLGSGVGKEQAQLEHTEDLSLLIRNVNPKYKIKINRNSNTFFLENVNKIILQKGDEILFRADEDEFLAHRVKVVDIYQDPLNRV